MIPVEEREKRKIEEDRVDSGREGRILACIVNGKVKGCKWERQEGTKASRLRSIK